MNSAINGAHIYTRAELNALDKFKQGASLRQIAEELGVSDGTVTNWLRSLGMYRKQRKPTRPRTRDGRCYPSTRLPVVKSKGTTQQRG